MVMPGAGGAGAVGGGDGCGVLLFAVCVCARACQDPQWHVRDSHAADAEGHCGRKEEGQQAGGDTDHRGRQLKS